MQKRWFGLLSMSMVCLAVAGGVEAATLCDNFGREWTVNLVACSGWNAPLTQCITGARDINNELGCGPLRLDGTYVKFLGVFSVTAYDTPSDACISTHWSGRGSLTSTSGNISGVVSNEGGTFGAFTLNTCGSTSSVDDGGDDPARPE
jgi:hypothetical protein